MTTSDLTTDERVAYDTPYWREIAETRAKVIALRKDGVSYASIAQALGISKSRARKAGQIGYEKGLLTFEQFTDSARSSQKAKTDEEYNASFMARVTRSVKIDDRGCWIWQKTISSAGYGMSCYRNKAVTVHRKVFEIVNGIKLSVDDCICHTCDIRPCCNPAHLWKGTHKDNNVDSRIKGRHYEARVTNCPRGHAYDEANTYRTPSGARACRICQRAIQRLKKGWPEHLAYSQQTVPPGYTWGILCN